MLCCSIQFDFLSSHGVFIGKSAISWTKISKIEILFLKRSSFITSTKILTKKRINENKSHEQQSMFFLHGIEEFFVQAYSFHSSFFTVVVVVVIVFKFFFLSSFIIASCSVYNFFPLLVLLLNIYLFSFLSVFQFSFYLFILIFFFFALLICVYIYK